MKSSSRWLIAFLACISVVVIVTLVLVLTLTGEDKVTLLPEDTPEGTVQRYFLAIEAEDYEKAFSYLSPEAVAEDTRYASYEEWSETYLQRRQTNAWKATLEESVITNDRATVVATIDIFKPGNPFENPIRTRYYTFILQRLGAYWRITAPVYPLYFN